MNPAGQCNVNFLFKLLVVACISHGLVSDAYHSTTSLPNRNPALSTASNADAPDRTLHRHCAPSCHDTSHASHAQSNPTGRRAFFRRSTAALASATVATAATSVQAASPVPSLGGPAPDFSLMNTRGKQVTLDALAADGKWTVLYFYPGAFTSGCTIEARKFQEDLASYREANAQVVGVSVDSVAKNADFCSSEGLDFFMLTDEGGRVSKAYGSSLSIPGFGTFSNRQTYIIDPTKNVRWVFVDVESHITKHSGEVLDKLKMLQQDA